MASNQLSLYRLPTDEGPGGLPTSLPLVTEESSLGHIQAMFQAIDAKDWEALPAFFRDHAVYNRPGYPSLIGIHEIDRFYRRERIIQSGTHRIESFVQTGAHCCAIGHFEGFLKSGQGVQIDFCDSYTLFNRQITFRKTYFYTPAV